MFSITPRLTCTMTNEWSFFLFAHIQSLGLHSSPSYQPHRRGRIILTGRKGNGFRCQELFIPIVVLVLDERGWSRARAILDVRQRMALMCLQGPLGLLARIFGEPNAVRQLATDLCYWVPIITIMQHICFNSSCCRDSNREQCLMQYWLSSMTTNFDV